MEHRALSINLDEKKVIRQATIICDGSVKVQSTVVMSSCICQGYWGSPSHLGIAGLIVPSGSFFRLMSNFGEC